MIVADTNLIAYSLIPSEFNAAADAVLRKDPIWAAPPLWRSEMRNVLALRLRQKLMNIEEAVEAMDKARQFIGGREHDVDSSRVLFLAQASNFTAYDCEFVSLAEKLNVPLVTSDKKLLAAFPDIAVSIKEFAG